MVARSGAVYAQIRALANPVAALPEDVATLQAMVLAMRGENHALQAKAAQLRAANYDAEARVARLYAILKMLERARYGRRSEVLDDDQHQFVFDEIQTGLAAIEAKLEAADPERTRTPTVRKALPTHLERVEEILEPDPAPCACGACDRVKIGEDVSERLDVAPARFRVIVTRRPRYACVACREGIVQAPAPARLIEAGLPTEGLLAHVAVSKYADGLPLYRQEAIYARDRVMIGRNVMAGWMGRVGFHLEPLADRILALIREGDRIFADETTLPALAPGTGRTKTAWLWTYARDDRPFGRDGPAIIAYRFEDSRGAGCPERHLAGFAGLLQCDGYSAYKRLADPTRSGDAVTIAACWAHLRRRFYKLHVAGLSETATWTVDRMTHLWAIEDRIRGQDLEARRAARQRLATPIVADLWARWDYELPRVPGRSKLAEAIRYAMSRWPILRDR